MGGFTAGTYGLVRGGSAGLRPESAILAAFVVALLLALFVTPFAIEALTVRRPLRALLPLCKMVLLASLAGCAAMECFCLADEASARSDAARASIPYYRARWFPSGYSFVLLPGDDLHVND